MTGLARISCRAKPAATAIRRAGAVDCVTRPTFAKEGGFTARDSTKYICISQ
jgi:hypothetical protein